MADGVRLLVWARFRAFRAFGVARRCGLDPKSLHDMRIACRRLSWALREFAPYVPKRQLTPPRRRLAKLAAALGGVREEDAAIAELEKLAGHTPAEVAAGVRAIAAERRRKRSRLGEDLTEQLQAGRLGRLEEELSRALRHAFTSAPEDRGEGSPVFGALVRNIIKQHLSKMDEMREGFLKPDNRRALRRMRREVRELRFALESLPSDGRGPADAFDDALGRLQTALGKIHDRDVWIADACAGLRRLDARPQDGTGGTQEWDAAVWLLAHFTVSRAKHFSEALALWSDWQARGLSERLGAYATSR